MTPVKDTRKPLTAEDFALSQVIQAPMPGKCALCGSTIARGTLVLFGKGRYAHEDCQRPAAAHAREHPEFARITDFREFPDIASYHHYAMVPSRELKVNARSRDDVLDAKNYAGAEWYGVAGGVDAVLDLLRTGGWPDGARIVEDLATYIDVPPPISIRRRRIRSDQGDTLDIHSVLSGNLSRAWEKPLRRAGLGNQNITLIASMQGLAHLSARTYLWRGAACLALCDLLTTAGYNVEILAEYRTDAMGITHRIKVKDGKVPVDVASLASCVCLAGFKRVLGFCALLHHLDDYGEARRAGQWQSLPAKERAPNEIAGFDDFDSHSEAELRTLAKDTVVKALERVDVFHHFTREGGL